MGPNLFALNNHIIEPYFHTHWNVYSVRLVCRLFIIISNKMWWHTQHMLSQHIHNMLNWIVPDNYFSHRNFKHCHPLALAQRVERVPIVQFGCHIYIHHYIWTNYTLDDVNRCFGHHYDGRPRPNGMWHGNESAEMLSAENHKTKRFFHLMLSWGEANAIH